MFNFLYRFSYFSDFNDITATPENISQVMELLNANGNKFIPTIIREQSASNQVAQNRMQFLDTDIIVRILSNRIDIERPLEENVNAEADFNESSTPLIHILKSIITAYNRKATRLAVNCENLFSFDDAYAFSQKLVGYNFGLLIANAPIIDWAHEFSQKVNVIIGQSSEECNFLTTLGTGMIQKQTAENGSDSKLGLIVSFDVNTKQENSQARFELNDIDLFHAAVTPLVYSQLNTIQIKFINKL